MEHIDYDNISNNFRDFLNHGKPKRGKRTLTESQLNEAPNIKLPITFTFTTKEIERAVVDGDLRFRKEMTPQMWQAFSKDLGKSIKQYIEDGEGLASFLSAGVDADQYRKFLDFGDWND